MPSHSEQRDLLTRATLTCASFPMACSLLLVACALFLVACGQGEADDPVTPNIVLIIGDDHGFGDFGFMGSEAVATPNLDALAAEGTTFSHAYVTASICAPSLRSLATGLHPLQHTMRLRGLASQGVLRGLDDEMRDFDTLPRLLAHAGYRGYQAGKFFGGRFDIAGFDEGTNAPGVDMRFGGPGRYSIGRETMQPVMDFFDAAAKDVGRRPFFLWFAPMLPHKPFNAPDTFVDAYRDRNLPGQVRGYYANVTRFDALVGEIVTSLEERGLRENTLIVYLSDNGWQPVPTAGKDPSWDSDGPQGKRSMYELAFRTPVIFSWPGFVPDGVRNDALISSVDLFPTLLDYASAAAAAGPGRSGHSLRPLIEGRSDWPRRAVFASMDNVRPSELQPQSLANGSPRSATMVRERDWYLIHYDESGFDELFDMRSDPAQRENVASSNPTQVQRLRGEIDRWIREARNRYSEAAGRPAATSP